MINRMYVYVINFCAYFGGEEGVRVFVTRIEFGQVK